MKNRLKIPGIVLILALLSGLLTAAAPVSAPAANLSWSNYPLPKLTVGTSANVYAFSGDGNTMFLFTAGTVNPGSNNTGKLYKSTDGGITWSNANLDNTPQVISPVAIKQIAVNPSNINDIVATDGAHVYRSINAGQTFYVFDPPVPPGTAVTSIDIASGSSGSVNILVGYSGAGFTGGAALFDAAAGIFKTTSFSTDANMTGALGSSITWGAANALAVAFSPNFANDAAIIVVAANAVSITVRGMIVVSGSDWNQSGSIKDAVLRQGGVIFPATATQIASIALPSDYIPYSTVQNRVFVGIGDPNVTNPNPFGANDVYRVNGGTSTSTAYALGAGINVSSAAYAGTATAGQLAAASYSGYTMFPTGVPILSTNQVTSNSPTWIQSSNSPSGIALDANCLLKFKPGSTAESYTLYAGTGGTFLPSSGVVAGSAKMSELATSTDLNSFWGVSLFEVSAYDNVVVGGSSGRGTSTVWQVITDRTSYIASSASVRDAMLFYSADGGNTYKKVLDNGIANISIYRSPAYATDKTIYLSQTDNTTTASGAGTDESKRIVKTSDGGQTWILRNTPGNVSLNWMSPIDANSYWIASLDRIQNSSSSTYATIEGNNPNHIFVFPGMIVVTTKVTGEVWVSTDNGVTFNRLGNQSTFMNNGGQTGPEGVPPPITFDVPNKTIYVVDLSTHNIMKWAVGTDISWQTCLNASQLPADLQPLAGTNSKFGHPISSISLGTDSIWYITSNNNSSNVNGVITPRAQIWYTADLLNIPFVAVQNSDVVSLGGIFPYPYSAGQTIDGSGNSVYFPLIQKGGVSNGSFLVSVGSPFLYPNGYTYQVLTFTNNTGTPPQAPTLVSPANGATVTGTSMNFQWSTSGGATNYWLVVEKASDNSIMINKAVGNVTSDTETGFPNDGTAYIWVVAAGNGSGWSSASTVRTFINGTVTIPAAPSLTAPGDGATVSGSLVNFQWLASSGATNYRLVVQKSSDNSTIINKEVGNVTSDVEIGFPNDGTAYKWMVAAGNSAGWSSSSSARIFINGSSTPAAPTLTSPADGATVSGTSVNFQWSASPGATNYWLAVFKASDNSVIVNKAVGNVTSDVESGFPNNGTQYSWVVAAGNSAGWGSASTARTFTNGTVVTIPPAPSLTSPAGGATVTGTSVTFQWAASSGATTYWLTVVKTSDNSIKVNKAIGNVTSDTEAGFPNDGSTYLWVVAAGNSTGWSSASTARTFANGPAVTVPAAPSLISPANGAAVTGTSVTFQWAASSGATTYWLVVFKASDNSVLINKAVGNVTSDVEIGFANDGSTYLWVVAAGNSAGWGSASTARTFTNGTTVTTPAAPSVTSPADGAKVTGSSVTFQWAASSGATIYWLTVVKVSDNSIKVNKAVGNVTSDTETGFPNDGTIYRWVVAAGNSAGWGSASTARTLTNGP